MDLANQEKRAWEIPVGILQAFFFCYGIFCWDVVYFRQEDASMYDIGIPEIVCTAKYEDTTHTIIKYDAEAAVRPEVCSNQKCDAPKPVRPHIHSKRTNQLRDVKSEGKLVIINLTVKHYRCPYCGQVIADQFSFYNKNSHMTNRLRDEFVKRSIDGETFSHIARDYSVDHKTVAAAFRLYISEHKKRT